MIVRGTNSRRSSELIPRYIQALPSSSNTAPDLADLLFAETHKKVTAAILAQKKAIVGARRERVTILRHLFVRRRMLDSVNSGV
jgi:hypothetical protein